MKRLALIVVLFMLCASIAFAGASSLRRRPVKPAPALQSKVLPSGNVEFSWRRYGDSLCLERRLSEDALFSIIAYFSRRETRFTDSTIAPNTTAYYRLRPARVRYTEEFGPEIAVSVSLPAPSSPQLSRIAVDSVLVELDAAAMERVLVERKVSGMFTVVDTIPRGETAIRDGGVETGDYAFYRLRYHGAVHTGPASRADSILMNLPPPAGLFVSYKNDHTVRLSWEAGLPFPCRYEIEKRSSAGVQTIRTESGADSWNDEHLAYAQRCHYRMRAIHGTDSSDYTTPVTAYYVLKPVTELRADPVHDLVVHLTWSDPDSVVAAYRIERSFDSLHFSPLRTLSGDMRSFSDSLSARGQTFYYRISSTASNGTTVASEVIRETIPFAQDGMVLVTDSADGNFYCDILEVSAAAFLDFCRASGREPPEDPAFPGHPEYWSVSNLLPAVNVSFPEVVAFCNWRSMSLGLTPAYDLRGQIIPGANGYRLFSRKQFLRLLESVADTTANLLDGIGVGAPVLPLSWIGSKRAVYNLIGNVWEWTNEITPTGGHVILGGAYCTARRSQGDVPEFCYGANYASAAIGFRCILPASR